MTGVVFHVKIDAHYRARLYAVTRIRRQRPILLCILYIIYFQYLYDVWADKTINTINNNAFGKHDAYRMHRGVESVRVEKKKLIMMVGSNTTVAGG